MEGCSASGLAGAFVLAAFVSGCAAPSTPEAGGVQVSTAPSSAVLGWALTRNRIAVSAGVELTDCKNGGRFEAAIQLAERPAADRIQVEVDGSGMSRSWFTDRNIEIQTYENGTLKGIGAEATNRASEVIGNVARTGINIARTVFTFTDAAGGRQLSEAELCSEAALANLAALRRARAEVGQVSNARRRAELASVIGVLRERLTVNLSGSMDPTPGDFPDGATTLSQVFTVSRRDVERLLSEGAARSSYANEAAIVPAGDATGLRVFSVKVTITLARPPSGGPPPQTPLRFAAYRSAVPANVVAVPYDESRVDGGASLSTFFPQLGTLHELPLGARLFQSSAWRLSLAPNGRLSEMSLRSSARAVSASAALASNTGAVADFAEARAAARVAARSEAAGQELRQLEGQRDRLQAEIEIIKARRELQSLRESGAP